MWRYLKYLESWVRFKSRYPEHDREELLFPFFGIMAPQGGNRSLGEREAVPSRLEFVSSETRSEARRQARSFSPGSSKGRLQSSPSRPPELGAWESVH